MRAFRVFTGCLLGLTSAAAIAACSGKTAPAKGQIMVVLQSDMAIPKDFNRVRVDISVRGQKVFSNTYVADDTGSLVLPGTIAVVAGEEETPSVEVSVVGISTKNEAQTFSKVITTMPRQRIATLRVPMQWLCTGQVLQLGKGVDAEYASKCQPEGGNETSCVAGTCVDVHVPEADLPTYSAPDVFGGGQYANDPSGTCFDVQACFKLGVDLAPDLDPKSPTYCQASIAVPANFDVNFAVKTPPGGAGVCDDEDSEAPCYVVLDQSDTFGWKAADSEGERPDATMPDAGTEPPGTAGRSSGGASGGAPSSGTGGAFGAGGATIPGGGGTGSNPDDHEGYIESGDWHGHLFLVASPAETVIKLTTPASGFPLCVSGVVAPTENSSGYAAIGFNIAQLMGMEPGTVLPFSKLGGIQLNLTSDETTPFRLGISGPDAQITPLQNWCAQVSAIEQLVPWGDFSNECWISPDSGPYDAEIDELTSVSVIVPGSPDPLPFDFCVHEISEQNIPQRVSPPQKTQSVPLPPGVRPQQSGASDGTVQVQFPTAVCDRLLEDPTLALRGTAACDKKTEATPICGPWSSVQAPQVPNPDGMLPDVPGAGGADGTGGASNEPPDGEGGAPVAAGGSSGTGGKAGAGGLPAVGGGGSMPLECDAPAAHEDTTHMIASFDGAQPEPEIETVDGRMGYAFSVGYGACFPATFLKTEPGAFSTAGALRASVPACETGPDNAVMIFVPLNSSALKGFSNGISPVPEQMCAYDAASYDGISVQLQASEGQGVRVAVITPDNLNADDAIPGGRCVSNCVAPFQTLDVGVAWAGYPIFFSDLGIDPAEILGIAFQPLSPNATQLFIDQLIFSAPLPP